MRVQSSSASSCPSLLTSLLRFLTHNPTASASLSELTANLTTSHHPSAPWFWPSASHAWITPRYHLCTLLGLFSAQQPDGIFQNVRNTFISLLKTLQSFPSHFEDSSQCSSGCLSLSDVIYYPPLCSTPAAAQASLF